jgi:hypothetical protein
MRTIFQIKKQIIGLYDLCYLFVKIKEYVLLVVNEYPKIYHKTSQRVFSEYSKIIMEIPFTLLEYQNMS